MTDLLAQSLANLANARNTVLEEMKNRYPVGSEVSWKAGKGFSTGHVIGHAPFWTREPTRLRVKPIRNGKARWVTPYNIPLASYAAPPAQGIDLGQSHAVLTEVAAERARQEEKWGQQNHVDWTRTTATSDLAGVWPGGVGPHFKWITDYKAAGKEGHSLGYFDILMEEVAEAHDEARDGNVGALREEVIQVAAVAVAWVECIDRRKALIDQRDAAPGVGA